jgi:hypothetical protein
MKFITLFFLFNLSINLSAQTIIYVNQHVQGGQNTGNSWADALVDLQDALSLAVDGSVIWVAKGTYFPTQSNDRSISFVLKNGVKIYGGFQGGETSINQRDFELHPTTLSGEIASPSALDNTNNVVYGEGLDSTTVLDGFIIEKGYAVTPNQTRGGGMCIKASALVYNTCPVIRNITFINNRASIGGGLAIVRELNADNFANPEVRNCQFIVNQASLFGGGMAKIGPAVSGSPFILDQCTFTDNRSTSEGGGMYVSDAEHTFIFNDCVFENNTSTTSLGGGVYFASGYEAFTGATLLLNNCTFSENTGTEGGGLYYFYGGIPNFSVPPFHATLTDCTFTQNTATNGYGGAFGFVGINSCTINVDLIGCEISNNLTHAFYTSFFEASVGSNYTVQIRDCKYVGNKDLENPDKFCFPVSLGIGGIGSRMDARIENCLFIENGGGVSSLCSINGGGINTHITNCTFLTTTKCFLTKVITPPSMA